MWDPIKVQERIKELGLDQPIPVQWFNWLVKVAQLDFGVSMSSGTPAMQLVFDSLPTTLELILYSAPLIILFAVWLGTKAALNHNKTVDHVARIAAILGTALPVFVLGTILISTSLMFYNQFHFIPLESLSRNVRVDLIRRIENGTFTQYTGMNTIDALLNGDLPLFLDAAEHLILPVALLVATQGVALMRVTRSGLIEELGRPYMATAVAKGLSKKDAAYKHARKNMLISVLTVSGLLLGSMLTGLVIVERVFMIPGFGNLLVSSARRFDLPVIIAGTTFVAVVFVLINLTVDILYSYIDRRIKLR
jgi:peptide/nickel transport system permease protein